MVNQQLLRRVLPIFLSFCALPAVAAKDVLEKHDLSLSSNRLVQQPSTDVYQIVVQAVPEREHQLARADALNQQVMALYQSGRYDEAIELAEEALALRRQVYGDAHPDVATSMNNLALLYHTQGRYDGAESLYEEALALYRQVYGDSHPDVAMGMNNLAALYQDQGRYNEAEPLYEEALALLRRVHGDAHPDVATSMNNLA